jgi:hypothetical protein
MRSDFPSIQIASQIITLMFLRLVFERINSFCYFCCDVQKTHYCLLFSRSIDASWLKIYVCHLSYVQSLRVRHHSRRIFVASSVRNDLCFAIYFLILSFFKILCIVFVQIGRLRSMKTCSYVSFGFLWTYLRRVLRSQRDNLEGWLERESVMPSWRCWLRLRVDWTVTGVKNVFRLISAFWDQLQLKFELSLTTMETTPGSLFCLI